MAYCVNCGAQLQNNDKFCANCGQIVTANKTENTTRKVVYDGEIHKCPNCGEVLDSFVTVCPACGYELRGASTTSAVKEFAFKLENAVTEHQKANIIRSFPIPNTKEDICEFMFLASSNISGAVDNNIFEAWVSKFEQTYQKAQITLHDDQTYSLIQEIYEKTEKEIKKERISHTTQSVGNVVTKYFKFMPNPIVAVVLILLIMFNLIRFFKGQFAGMDIIFDVIILGITYGITNKKNKSR